MSPKFEEGGNQEDQDMKELEESLAAEEGAAKISLKPSSRPVVPETPKVEVKVISPEKQAKLDALKVLTDQHEKKHGSGVVKVASVDYIEDAEFIPTGIFPVDTILGGGIPRGKIIELYGPEMSGKTTLALQCIAQFQKYDELGGLIDAEHALDRLRAAHLNVDLDFLRVWNPEWGEQALDITEEVVNSGAVSIVVVDSVAALVPKEELDGEMGDSQMGLQARMIGKALRKLKGACRRNNCTVIFINQIREKIGVVFGNPETTPGGRALKFFADVRIDVRRHKLLKSGDIVMGQITKMKTVKNKLCPPHQEALFTIYFDERGIDEVGSVLDAALQMNVIQQNGNWLALPIESEDFPDWGGKNLAQGRDNAIAWLSLPENAEFLSRLRTIMTNKMLSVRKQALETAASKHRLGQLKADSPPEESSGKRRGGKKGSKKKDKQ